jgi:hypothetical protein
MTDRIDGAAALADFKMQLWPVDIAGAAGLSYLLTPAHHITQLYIQHLIMAIGGDPAAAMAQQQ